MTEKHVAVVADASVTGMMQKHPWNEVELRVARNFAPFSRKLCAAII